ncbi:CRAL-TRIO domain-containing protein C23B6.04c [Psilocybe cubensis]|uniref:CRAL-TRIO domain-containing protein C23B6.04c n=2 Tax=Psilocybe cubensis TaxID=181762 RepID=A0ACB8H043_PSICU|nr:CRAL-TRIO domain-containing protein C23B6.04c [Psilocybe cubensis]KAH9481360.1 CRAL-TRIO domain-containing protein C23B6.04c [Psilocybe cubensis]
MSTAEKVFLPIPPPVTPYKDDPRAVLSKSEQAMYDEVLAHFTRADPVYVIPNIEKGELTEQEKFWLSRECLLRYLRASKWKVSGAIQRLESTLAWRREFGMYDTLNANLVEPEAVTGKEVLYGYDTTGKPACYMIPSRQNTTEGTRQIQYAVWMLERCVDLMGPGVETLALLINFGDRGKNPSVSTALSVLHILQNHYPERLGLALIINVPFLVNAFFKMVMPLVDPITRQKVKFNPEIFKDGFFTKDNVMREWSGDCNFEYQHEKYWPNLVSICEERVKIWFENWKALGAKIGISEWAYKQTGTPNLEEEKKGEASVTVSPAADAAESIATPGATTTTANAAPETTGKVTEEPSAETPVKKSAGEAPAPVASHATSTGAAVVAGGAISGADANAGDSSAAADGGAAE